MPPVVIPRSEHGLSRRDVDPDALKVLYRLKDGGFKAYLVGGGVRDLLLGRRPKDFDIGTDAHPSQVKRLFRNCFIVGRRFRLAHVRFGTKVIEVATFRRQTDVTPTASIATTRSAPTKRTRSAATSRSTRSSTTSPPFPSSTTRADSTTCGPGSSAASATRTNASGRTRSACSGPWRLPRASGSGLTRPCSTRSTMPGRCWPRRRRRG
jgi:hypothetical protein